MSKTSIALKILKALLWGLGASLVIWFCVEAYYSPHAMIRSSVNDWNAMRENRPSVRVNFKRMDLSGYGLSGKNFRNADLREANLKWTMAEHTDFREADFSRASFEGTHLTGADLSGANLTEAYFLGVDLNGVNLTGVTLNFTIFRNTTGTPIADPKTLEYIKRNQDADRPVSPDP